MLRCWVLFAWFVSAFAASSTVRAEPSPPDYVVPARPKHRFVAGGAPVVVTDVRPTLASTPGADAPETEPPHADEGLATELQKRLNTVLGTGRERLVVRVKRLEGREISESPAVVRAVIDVSVEEEGRTLATTRGTSTLHGSIGGMTARTEERIEAATLDAFERSVLRTAFIDSANAALADPKAGAARVPETRNAWTIREHESSAAAHVVSAVFDGGATYSFAARYLHDHVSSGPGLFWGGYGVEARLITDRVERLDASAGLVILRGGTAFEQGFSVEFGLGAGGKGSVRAIGVAGVYLSLYFVDAGFTYQFVINPTADLEPLQGPHFGLRINIPIAAHGVTVRCHSPLPCRPELPPGFGTE
jgi:hypothetical protein